MDKNIQCSIKTCNKSITSFCGCDVCGGKKKTSEKKAYCGEKCQGDDEAHLRLVGFWAGKKSGGGGGSCATKTYGCPPRQQEKCQPKGKTTYPIVPEVHQMSQNNLDQLSKEARKDEKILTVCGVEVRLIIKYNKKRFSISAWHGTTRFYHKKLKYETGDDVSDETMIDDEVVEKKEEVIEEEEEEEGEEMLPLTSKPKIRVQIINVPNTTADIGVSWIYIDEEIYLSVFVN